MALHCAGPFVHTVKQLADACFRTRTHYLDNTGESRYSRRWAPAMRTRVAGIMVLPGAGFDVVPNDCLAAHLKRRLPSAASLALAFQVLGRVSRGTATTAVENLARGGMVGRAGTLVAVPAAYKTRVIDLGRGLVTASTDGVAGSGDFVPPLVAALKEVELLGLGGSQFVATHRQIAHTS